ncbi:MAG: LysR substrate-binding domain-containing protein [Shewanella sp.]|nr:LysR substrate-binding domain-containing protein [Shewanella sp.]
MAVVDNGSFTAAAQSLGISKPVVSKHITLLESHLGVQLLQRTTRRIHLTQAGETYAEYAQRILADVREAEESVAELQKAPQGRLKLSCPESLAVSLLAEHLPEFQARYPKLELDIRITGRFIDLVAEGIDVALRMGSLEDSSLMARKLMNTGFQVCASKAYIEKRGTPCHPSELNQHNCLIYTQGQFPEHWMFEEKGKHIKVRVTGNCLAGSGSLLIQLATQHRGIIMAPSFMVDKFIQRGELVPLLEDFMPSQSALYAMYPYSKIVSKKVRVFIDYLAEKLQQTPCI